MRCVSCGAAKLVHDTRDVPYTYKGQSTVILGITGDYCSTCGDSVHEGTEAQRYSAAIMAFNKEVNSSIVDPEFIVQTRKKLNLDQREAAEIFGGGANGFSRYETGKTKPSLALVQLLKILNNHPDLINEIKPEQFKAKEAVSKAKITRRKNGIPTRKN